MPTIRQGCLNKYSSKSAFQARLPGLWILTESCVCGLARFSDRLPEDLLLYLDEGGPLGGKRYSVEGSVGISVGDMSGIQLILQLRLKSVSCQRV